MAQEASFDKLSSGQTFYFYLHQQCSPPLLPLATLFLHCSLAERRADARLIHIFLPTDENFP